MVGYWLFKFERNSDITLIEYTSLDDLFMANDQAYPELTICVFNPFIVERFNITNTTGIKWKYYNYLKGKGYSKTFKDIQYEDVTVNLADYLDTVRVHWKAGRVPKTGLKGRCNDTRNCPYYTFKTNYNGFEQEELFQKCFGTELNKMYVKDVLSIRLMFNESLKNVINDTAAVYVSFNYPNQIIRPRGGSQLIWHKNDKTSENMVDIFHIISVELLKRRNKQKKKCTAEWNIFDQLVLKKHIEKVGCRAPYMSQYPEFPMCNTQKEIRKAYYDGWTSVKDYADDPCQEMAAIDFKTSRQPIAEGTPNRNKYRLLVIYPFKAKTVTQLKEVDVHTLIGNIGGYIGLFLGKLLFSAHIIKYRSFQNYFYVYHLI